MCIQKSASISVCMYMCERFISDKCCLFMATDTQSYSFIYNFAIDLNALHLFWGYLEGVTESDRWKGWKERRKGSTRFKLCVLTSLPFPFSLPSLYLSVSLWPLQHFCVLNEFQIYIPQKLKTHIHVWHYIPGVSTSFLLYIYIYIYTCTVHYMYAC